MLYIQFNEILDYKSSINSFYIENLIKRLFETKNKKQKKPFGRKTQLIFWIVNFNYYVFFV